jgi:hypothetical protein
MPPSNSYKYQRHHLRGDTRLKSITEHALLNPSLFKLQSFLTGTLLFLPPSIFLRFGT